MRTIASALSDAQKQPNRRPYVSVVFENKTAAARRLELTTYIGTDQTVAQHGVAAPADDSMTRVRSDGAGGILRQRITLPTQPAQWNAWTTHATGKGNVIACAAKGTRVAIVYTDSAGTGIKLIESTDHGATYGSEVAVTTAPAAVGWIAVAYKNTGGDLAIAWVSASGGNTVRIIIRTSGAFGSVANPGTIAATINGIALVYGFDWDIALTGTETTTLKPTLWTLIYGDGIDAPPATWSTLRIQQQADVAASVTFQAPFLAFDAAGVWYMTFVEVDAFVGGSTRTYIAFLPSLSFDAGAFTWSTPRPFNYSGTHGLAIAYGAGASDDWEFLWCTANNHEAAFNFVPRQYDASERVLRIELDELPAGSRGRIDLDNADGALTNLHTSAGVTFSLRPPNLATIALGYYTASGNLGSTLQQFWIESVEHVRDGGLSIVRVHIVDFWALLERSRARTQIVHGGDTYFTVLARAFSRAGLTLTRTSASARLSAVTPAVVIPTTEDGATTVRRLLAFLADRIRGGSAGSAVITEPLAAAAANFTFTAAYPLHRVNIRHAGERVTQLQALGNAAFGEAIDSTNALLGIGVQEQQRDISSTTGAAAAATAAAALRQRELDTPAGVIVCAPHVALELYDLIELTDVAIASTALKRRIAGIRWRYDRTKRATVYEQTLELSVP